MCTITLVTTAGRPDDLSMTLAKKACEKLNIRFEPRNKRSVTKISQQFDANIIVAGKNRYEYYPKGATAPFFFHPNSAAFRLKRVARGETDPFLEACNMAVGDSLLDCTLGMGADAMLAAFIAGETGKVVGLEDDENVAFIVDNGMKTYDTTELPLTSCMRHIEVVQSEAIEYLKQQKDNSFDIVYMDPMFEEVIEESNNFEALREAGSHVQLSQEWVDEALRVARKRVVLKAHFRSTFFEDFGFKREIRLTSKFHYGVLVKE
ncbi:class I SAM-dependent methyltransferase [Ureibacillus chungkukjangi]|uniref:Putative SAM-dependent methyltransferase n=1 Tax=Ureibacillus chungkukjangi TaxID=1202712 RepID=A0A318TKE4_9BACL|nr:class I SAM-dependent methyltransferase [Ureibacillus chungkukjangi]PYF05196.1 putative SAM-dependent methyltransferase [Ureibacillus chungkukjangi]